MATDKYWKRARTIVRKFISTTGKQQQETIVCRVQQWLDSKQFDGVVAEPMTEASALILLAGVHDAMIHFRVKGIHREPFFPISNPDCDSPTQKMAEEAMGECRDIDTVQMEAELKNWTKKQCLAAARKIKSRQNKQSTPMEFPAEVEASREERLAIIRKTRWLLFLRQINEEEYDVDLLKLAITELGKAKVGKPSTSGKKINLKRGPELKYPPKDDQDLIRDCKASGQSGPKYEKSRGLKPGTVEAARKREWKRNSDRKLGRNMRTK